ncbi:hypothetical protein MBLNU230_g5748t2 [Neophaeotheca triangularis]
MTEQQKSGTAEGAASLPVLQERQDCPSGTSFYSCPNGYRGCCSFEPCNLSGGCPDFASGSSTTSSGTQTTTSISNTATGATTSGNSRMSTTTRASPSTTSASAPTEPDAPDCPNGNNTVFADRLRISYTVHCNTDSTTDAFNSVDINSGGYGECFAACSTRSDCAGFTFSGLGGGTCYYKSDIGPDSFVRGLTPNFISASKTNPDAVADPQTSQSSPANRGGGGGGGTNIGAIVGGVLGAIAGLLLLLLLIAICARRRRKKIEERRSATVTTHSAMGGPIETQRLNDYSPGGTNNQSYAQHDGSSYAVGRGRQGSTAVANDVFAPYGGFYRGTQYTDNDRKADAMHHEGVAQAHPTTTGSEKSGFLPPTLYQRPAAARSADKVAMLDSRPVTPRPPHPNNSPRPTSQHSSTGSSRFREHLQANSYEMADTSPRAAQTPIDTDSPTLGREAVGPVGPPTLADQVRRKQHLMSWNNYPGAHEMEAGDDGVEGTMRGASPRTPPGQRVPLSPPTPGRPGLTGRESVVSPLRGRGRGRR